MTMHTANARNVFCCPQPRLYAPSLSEYSPEVDLDMFHYNVCRGRLK
jgi:hypothetical protein